MDRDLYSTGQVPQLEDLVCCLADGDEGKVVSIDRVGQARNITVDWQHYGLGQHCPDEVKLIGHDSEPFDANET